MLRGSAGCGLDFLFVAVQAAGQTSAVRARICQNMRGGAGCGPNDTVAGRVRAQLVQPAQFKFSQNLHIVSAY